LITRSFAHFAIHCLEATWGLMYTFLFLIATPASKTRACLVGSIKLYRGPVLQIWLPIASSSSLFFRYNPISIHHFQQPSFLLQDNPTCFLSTSVYLLLLAQMDPYFASNAATETLASITLRSGNRSKYVHSHLIKCRLTHRPAHF
jgi:hypothetical protein